VAYERNGETFETVIDLPEGQKVELIGVSALMETYHPSFSEAVQVSFSYVKLVGSTVARIIMPQHTIEVVSQSSSIVGISAMASEAAASGMEDLILLAAAISMSLGFMNLLPVPPLDGGKILIELIQLIARRPLSAKAQSAVSYLGLAFFLFIFCFALRNDIVMLLGLG
jgi:regulator of sigma E protease